MTMIIWISAMLIGSLAWVFWFLKNPLSASSVDLRQSNINLGKQRKLELQRDLDLDLIDQEQFNLALEEISSTLAVELDQKNTITPNSTKMGMSIWIVAVLLPVFSVGVYQQLTTYSKSSTIASTVESVPLTLEQSVKKTEQHVEDNPGDVQAWRMLGLGYFELKQVDKSLNAYERAYQLSPNDPKLLVEYASTMISANDDQFVGRPMELIKQALQIDPNAPDALYLAGMFAVSMQDFELARGLWNKALKVLPEGSADQQALLSILDELKRTENPQVSNTVTVNVNISDQILANRSKQDYLMIYVKVAKGRPMPIAIEKIQLKDFVGQVTLSDLNSVMPTKLLSEHDQVLVVARLSRTGGAMKQVDDLQVTSNIISVQNNPSVTLTLN